MNDIIIYLISIIFGMFGYLVGWGMGYTYDYRKEKEAREKWEKLIKGE